MILYLSIIFIAGVILSVIDYFVAAPVFGFELWFIIVAVVVSIVAEIAIDGLFAFIVRRLPAKWFDHRKKFFIVSAGEKKFYEKLKIRKWKDKVPELGQFTNFRKNKIAEPRNNDYLDRYLLEACYGEVCHIAGIIAGFLVIFCFPLRYFACFGLPVAIVNVFMNLPSLFILRYNSTKLKVLYESNERREKREKKAGETKPAAVGSTAEAASAKDVTEPVRVEQETENGVAESVMAEESAAESGVTEQNVDSSDIAEQNAEEK